MTRWWGLGRAFGPTLSALWAALGAGAGVWAGSFGSRDPIPPHDDPAAEGASNGDFDVLDKPLLKARRVRDAGAGPGRCRCSADWGTGHALEGRRGRAAATRRCEAPRPSHLVDAASSGGAWAEETVDSDGPERLGPAGHGGGGTGIEGTPQGVKGRRRGLQVGAARPGAFPRPRGPRGTAQRAIAAARAAPVCPTAAASTGKSRCDIRGTRSESPRPSRHIRVRTQERHIRIRTQERPGPDIRPGLWHGGGL